LMNSSVGAGGVGLSQTLPGTDLAVNLKKGDFVEFYTFQNTGAALLLLGDVPGFPVSYYIFKKESAQTLAGGEVVHCRYGASSGQSVVNGATVVYNSKVEDTHNAYNSATGIFTAPHSDYYTFESNIITQIVAGVLGTGIGLNVFEVTSIANNFGALFYFSSSGSTRTSTSVVKTIYLSKGHQASIRFNSNIAATTLNTSVTSNQLSITNRR